MSSDFLRITNNQESEPGNSNNDAIVVPAPYSPSGVPKDAQVPYPPFEWLLCDNYPLHNRYWHLENSSTLLIGGGDLTAVALMFAKNCAWHETVFLNAVTNPQPILFFKGVHEPLMTNFADQLWQLDVPEGFPGSSPERIPPAGCKVHCPPTYRDLAYLPKIYTYPPECEAHGIGKGMKNFKWTVYPNLASLRPWQPYFQKELTRLKPCPRIIFCDGWLDGDSRFLRNDVLAVDKWLKELKKQKTGIVLVVPQEKKFKKLYRLFDQVIEIKPWRAQKCGERNLTATLQKLEGEKQKYPIRFRIKSPEDKIAWTETGKHYDQLRPVITALTREGYTAKRLLQFLMEKYKIKLSPSMLAKLKQDWDVYTYKRSMRAKQKTK